ncbi:hypothetical protein I533_16635 [Alteromonas mediterranea MED64]|uniref:hypothetical protein n=1 Tax=Alteromonas mediterranea TaxID=314275 RepID=UPI00035558B7|nr:hypothetical protein [Alteromonas mediterranea]AGP83278.1 hypothetical protein I533_16635 [Alteromonas mediterranea MED64]
MKTLSVITGFVVIVVFFVLFFDLFPNDSADESLENSNTSPVPFSETSKSESSTLPHQSNTNNLPSVSNNSDAAKLGLETDPELIAEIEREMQFSEAPEGDLSYMSPESETLQLDEEFPGLAPDPQMTMPGNLATQDDISSKDIGKPLEKNTKMDDLPLN